MALIDCEYHEAPQIQARINQLMKMKEQKSGDKPKGNLDKLNKKLDTEFNKYLDASCKKPKTLLLINWSC